ncbi:hypothetical protein [Taibaiella koreensis]|uniref:hypothetical protein n=1 Tax=Taibaiella koreensis TaxID=1268548 RepID=UPI000E599481|nr:hypothetical protein [Taibaiella koreensis]
MKKNLPEAGQYINALKGTTQVKTLRLSMNFQESVLPPALEDWLGRLSLLYGVPFEHLVPNAAMLPLESLRFFYVDPNWTSSLVDGALSVGAQSSRDTALIRSVYEQVQHSLEASMQLVRRRLAGAELPEQVNTGMAVSGLLMRSQLVSGWPGLEIAAYEDYTIDGRQNIVPVGKIENLRIQRLAPDVMLCLYGKMPKLVQLNEPKEGLAFGVRSDGKLVPRYMGYQSDQPVGAFVTGNPKPEDETAVARRSGGLNVIDVAATKAGLVTILNRYNAMGPSGTLTPADFGIQLIKSAEQQSFLSGTDTQPNPNDCTDY